MNDRSYIRTGKFIFQDGVLKQEVTVIRHKPTQDRKHSLEAFGW